MTEKNMITLAFIGFTIDVIGKVLIAYTAIRVHHRFWKEHRVDERVFRSMKKEQLSGIVGIALIVIGYVLQASDKLGF